MSFFSKRSCADIASERFPDVPLHMSAHEKIEFERSKAREEENKVQVAILEEMKVADDRERQDAHSYNPKVTISKGAATSYIQFEKLDVGAQFIETITTIPGTGPYLYPGWYGCADIACRGESTIIVKTITGAEHRILISRWKADALFAALMKAWRETR